MSVIVITIFLFLIYACLIIYYRQSWIKIPVSKGEIASGGYFTFISVIIPARDEEGNIGACLDSIINQSYPKNLFEIIVIDDFSTDRTAEIIRSFADKNVSLISLKNFTKDGELNSYKKKAIEIAISKANGELIVTTDADCIVQNKWLQTIASFYEKHNPVFIAAPVAYFPSPAGEGK